ncbi:MAG TPA: metal-sensitive transcriptional regulator [Candidatus Gracilibacteria bacterium]|nr:metal-sensitive transcriptional regulator [Candidatus Gracilibacteria bacterium]
MVDPFKRKTVSRLKRAKGQIDGIIKMVEEDKYCVDIITQVLAVEGSLNAVSRLILESHLNTCGTKHLASNDGKKKDKFIREIMKIVEFSGR